MEVTPAQAVKPINVVHPEPIKAPVSATPPTPATQPTVVDKPTEPAPDQLSPRFAELTKRERSIVGKEKQLKDLEEKYKDFQDFTKNPKKALETKGITLEKFIEGYLAEGENKPVGNEADLKLKEIQEKLALIEKNDKERENQTLIAQQQENVKRFKGNVLEQIKGKPEFAMCEKMSTVEPEFEQFEAGNLMLSVMEQYYYRTERELGQGQMLEWKEAAKTVEKFYQGLSQKFVPQAPPPAQSPKAAVTVSPTLTNQMAPSGVKVDAPMLSSEESIKVLAEKMRQMRANK